MKQVIAGIDIGGTKIALALATANCEVLTKCTFPTLVKDGAHKILQRTLDKLDELLKQENAELKAIGIGCAGPLDTKRGITLSPPNLPGWDKLDICALIG